MRIIVNQQEHQLDEECTVQQLIEQLTLNPNGLALAINQTVVSKSSWANTQLQPDDQVVAFQIVTGG